MPSRPWHHGPAVVLVNSSSVSALPMKLCCLTLTQNFLRIEHNLVRCLPERQASACSRPGAESRFSKSTIAVLFDTVILETPAANGYGMISMFEQLVGATSHTTKVPSITSNYYLLPVLSSTTKPFPLECNEFLSSASAHPPQKNYVFCQNKKTKDILWYIACFALGIMYVFIFLGSVCMFKFPRLFSYNKK